MKKGKTNDQPPAGIAVGELLPLRTLGKRLALGSRSLQNLQREGLRAISVGKNKYFLTSDVIQFFQKKAAEPSGTERIMEESCERLL